MAVAIFAAHVWFHLTWAGLHGLSPTALLWTDVRWDFGPQSWLSWLTMFLVGVAALRLAVVRDRQERRGWLLFGTLFVYLALDDALLLHERVTTMGQDVLGGVLVYGWVVFLLPVFAIAGALILLFLLRTLQTRGRRLMVLGFGCLGCAAALETIEMSLLNSNIRFRGFVITEYTQTVEEFLEFLGPAFLLLCTVHLKPAPTQDPAEAVPEAAEQPVRPTSPTAKKNPVSAHRS